MSDQDEAKIKFKNEMQPEEAAVYFEALVDGLRKGSLQLQQAGEKLVLTPTGDLKVEIRASKKDDKSKFSFEMSWKAPKESQTITLGADQPE